MRHRATVLAGAAVLLGVLASGADGAHKLRVVTTIPDFKALVADLFVENGLELDAWSDTAVQGANNPKIVRGAPGRVDASRGIQVLEVPSTRVDRSSGDVHPWATLITHSIPGWRRS